MNEENNQLPKQDKAPKSENGAATVSQLTRKNTNSRKWVFPAVYVAAAAIILTIMWVYRDAGKSPVSSDQAGLSTTQSGKTGAVTTNGKAELMSWPVADRTAIQVSMEFYEQGASNDVKKAAVVEYGDSFTPHMGIDLSREDSKPFDVTAALAGKVTRSEQVPLVGYLVEIEHANGLKTVYQSLSEVKVKKDDQVKQGDLIAKAGRNELEKDENTHLHFEVLLDGKPVNPQTYLTDK